MAEEPLAAVGVDWHGVAGDRRWAFVRPNTERNGFPWLTLRQRAEMRAYQPSLLDPDRPDRSVVRVRTPTGEKWDLTDQRLADELGAGVRVLKQDHGVFDSAPLSIVTTSSLAALSRLSGRDVEVGRLRPHLLLDLQSDVPFPEEQWVGRTLRVGTVRLQIDRRTRRCSIVNLNPRTGERAPEVLPSLARQRDRFLGVYASVVQGGRVDVGERPVLED